MVHEDVVLFSAAALGEGEPAHIAERMKEFLRMNNPG